MVARRASSAARTLVLRRLIGGSDLLALLVPWRAPLQTAVRLETAAHALVAITVPLLRLTLTLFILL